MVNTIFRQKTQRSEQQAAGWQHCRWEIPLQSWLVCWLSQCLCIQWEWRPAGPRNNEPKCEKSILSQSAIKGFIQTPMINSLNIPSTFHLKFRCHNFFVCSKYFIGYGIPSSTVLLLSHGGHPFPTSSHLLHKIQTSQSRLFNGRILSSFEVRIHWTQAALKKAPG